MASVHEKERSWSARSAARSSRRLPGVEVLAVELTGPERFTVYIDHAAGRRPRALRARHATCSRDYLREYGVDVSSPGLERPLRKPEHFRSALGRQRRSCTTDGAQALRGEVVARGRRRA